MEETGIAPNRRSRGIVGDSSALALGTVLSRTSGFGRVLLIPAIFGATSVGDVFLAANALPLTVFAMIGGQALGSILVPVLVRAFEKDPARAEAIGRSALTMITIALGSVVALGLVFNSTIASGLTLGIQDQGDASAIARILLLFMVPQLVLYGYIAFFVAYQQARGKFFLPAVAPTVENLTLIVVMIAVAIFFGDVHQTTATDTVVLLALGAGSTIALVFHLVIQAIGAAKAGARLGFGPLRPPSELAAQRGQLTASLGWTLSFGLRIIALIIASGWVGAGGIQAFQIGFLLQNLPMALIGYPIAAAILPRLAELPAFSAEIANVYSNVRDLVGWVFVPIGIGLIVLSAPIGDALSIGRFSSANGPELIAASISGLALSAASEAVYEIARQTTLAHGRTDAFTRSIWIRGAISAIGIVAAPMLLDGPRLLLALGLVVSASDLAALYTIDRPLRRLANRRRSATWALAKPVAAALIAAVVCLLVGSWLSVSAPIARLAVLGPCYLVVYLATVAAATDRGSQVKESWSSVQRILSS